MDDLAVIGIQKSNFTDFLEKAGAKSLGKLFNNYSFTNITRLNKYTVNLGAVTISPFHLGKQSYVIQAILEKHESVRFYFVLTFNS